MLLRISVDYFLNTFSHQTEGKFQCRVHTKEVMRQHGLLRRVLRRFLSHCFPEGSENSEGFLEGVLQGF